MARRRHSDVYQPDLFASFAQQLEQFVDRFAVELRRAADRATKEEDVHTAVERLLGELESTLNVRIEGQQQYTLLRGQVDTVYGSVFIEYKNPADPASRLGPELTAPGTRKVVEQVKRRFADVAALVGGPGRGMVGIGCDGRYFVFCRFIAGETTVEEPVPVSRWSARRFLWAILNLQTRGFALTPPSLAQDFGSGSERAGKGISAFLHAIGQHESAPRVGVFFRQWKILFGEVCGYDMSSPRAHLKLLVQRYGTKGDDPIKVLFALHTYYALFMKLLAAHVVSTFQRIGASAVQDIEQSPTTAALQDRLRRLEDGDVYGRLGVTNFLEGDLFSWYLSAWTPGIEDAIRSLASRLLEYSATSLRDDPRRARDLLKKLYQELVPRKVRHDLGEYYTPDWLAEQTLELAGYDGNPKTRLLDPACGSGTFLVLALARIQTWLERNFERTAPPDDIARIAARNILGFDLNPLAVLAARTNFVIQFYDLFDYRGRLEVPIYLCDSVLTPSEYREQTQQELYEQPVPVPTSARIFYVPREVTTERDTLARYSNLLAEYARERSGHTADDFLHQCRAQGILITKHVEDQHKSLFDAIRGLDRDRRNGVWARFIKNAFAPVFLRNERVDLVVGNPPWVNWESLPGRMEAVVEEGELPNYRQQIAEVFKHYGLFSLAGAAGRLGGGKKDLSMLFVYACADHYLRDGGSLAFVITQTVFKTKGAGDGFRRLQYPDNGPNKENGATVHLEVREVHDLSDFQPFESAVNRTALFLCRKTRSPGSPPFAWTTWTKTRRGRIDPNEPLELVRRATRRRKLGAIPVDPEKPTSPWLTAPKNTLAALRKIMGKSAYQAHAGACTWLNAVYWIKPLRDAPGGVLVENLYNVGKIKVERVQRTVEPDLIYPLLRGRDVRRWRAEPSAHIILAQDPQTRTGIPEAKMRRQWPRTFAYLKQFEDQLRQRPGYRKYFDPNDPFYSVYNVGPYTLSPTKVVWREQTARFQAAFIQETGDKHVVLPDHKLMFVPCSGGAREANYLCAALNSTPVCFAVFCFVLATSTSTHVLEHVAIPEYQSRNKLHARLAKLSEQAHIAAAKGRPAKLSEIERQIDEAAAELWELTPRELCAIQRALVDTRNKNQNPGDDTQPMFDAD